jgi:membrane protein required for colicin V production
VNWLDILIAGILLTSVISSVANGLARELISLASLLLGILCGLWWYPEVATHFEPATASTGVARFVAFFVILFAFLFAGWIAGRILRALIKAGGLRWMDRLLGAAFGLVRGVLASAAVVLAMVAFLQGPGATQSVARSRLAPTVLYGARGLVALAPQPLKDAFDRGWQRVRQVWRDDAA